MYRLVLSRRYSKALKRYSRRPDFNQKHLQEIISTLSRGERLAVKYLDHQLSGELANYRECHIKSDILLLYQIQKDILVLLLVKLGTHDDLFG